MAEALCEAATTGSLSGSGTTVLSPAIALPPKAVIEFNCSQASNGGTAAQAIFSMSFGAQNDFEYNQRFQNTDAQANAQAWNLWLGSRNFVYHAPGGATPTRAYLHNATGNYTSTTISLLAGNTGTAAGYDYFVIGGDDAEAAATQFAP